MIDQFTALCMLGYFSRTAPSDESIAVIEQLNTTEHGCELAMGLDVAFDDLRCHGDDI